MLEILSHPEKTADLAFEYVTRQDKVAAILSSLPSPDAQYMRQIFGEVHSCGALWATAHGLSEYDNPDERRSPPQRLLDLKVRLQTIVAQIVPPEALASIN